MIADEMYQYLEDNDMIGEGYRGTRETNLDMAWIDYQKAYDLVPHSWIIKTLTMVGASENVRGLLKNSMQQWTTKLESNGETLGDV